MSIVRPDLTGSDRRTGQKPDWEQTAIQREAARLLNYQRALIRQELDEERRQRQQPRIESRPSWWRRIDWHDLALRELLAAVLTGVVLSAAFYGFESRREQRMMETSERLENVRFVRQLSISSPDAPKPLSRIDLQHAELGGLNLTDANLSSANLTFANLTFADLSGAFLVYTNLSGANLSGANLTDAAFFNADLSFADLSLTNLTDANLTGANLTDAFLSFTNLTNADLSIANLTGANLIGANLTGANLTGANLTDAALFDANLFEADLTDVWWCTGHPPLGPQSIEALESSSIPDDARC